MIEHARVTLVVDHGEFKVESRPTNHGQLPAGRVCGGRYNLGFPVSLLMSSQQRSALSLLGICLGLLVAIAIGLAAIMMTVVFGGFGAHYGLLGLDATEKSTVLKYLGFAMGGVLVAIQAAASHMRAKAMEAVAKEHAEANRQNEAGLRQERLKSAIEHLGNKSESVRLGGAFELYHLAKDSAGLRQTVLDILCSHIRRTTVQGSYQKTHPLKPSEEVASLLSLLFMRGQAVFAGLRLDLRASWLNGADLRKARLSGANLHSAHLDGALLEGAHLEAVELSEAYLREARLSKAHLREARLLHAHMQGARLSEAQLQGAVICGGHLAAAIVPGGSLHGADLLSAELHGAILDSAQLQGARLSWAGLDGAVLTGARLEGAGDHHWSPTNSFSDRMSDSVGKATALSDVLIRGIEQLRFDQLVDDVLPGTRDALNQRVRPCLGGAASRGLPEGHGAIVGHYGREDAEIWINEHQSAMENIAATRFKAVG